MVTKKAVSKHIPREAINLSLGPDFCAYMLDGEVVTRTYAQLFQR